MAALEQLCLGDFAAVQRQAVILDTVMQPDEFLDQLEAEHRIKPEVREARSMGFLPESYAWLQGRRAVVSTDCEAHPS